LRQGDQYRDGYPNILDPKTVSLVNIGIMTALGLDRGLPLQIAAARDAGALRDEIISAMMMGLPGNREEIMEAYDRST
jgi:alkylhydroperoxidase/carboxymuconolactone decarboxylase family protein YurZ